MRLTKLIQGLGVRLVDPEAADRRVCDLTEDSRTAMPGSLFVARPGTEADGRAFVDDAIAGGAIAVLSDDPDLVIEAPRHAGPIARLVADDVPLACAQLAERFYAEPSSSLSVLGVTGTNGKTTVAWLLRRLLTRLGVRSGLVGTVCVDDGVTCAPAAMTTPPALELSRTLSTMVEAGCTGAAIEVSSHALAQRRVAAIRFAGAVFTNLSGDHLDYHGSMEEYASAKASLFAQLGPEACAVINADDAANESMVAECRARVVRVSMPPEGSDPAPGADVVGRVLELDWTGTRLEVSGLTGDPGERVEVRVPLLGRFNALNALLAGVSVARLTEVDGVALVRELAGLTAPPGRLQRVRSGAPDEPLVLVDYAHTDDALASALRALAELRSGGGGKLWCVFGCGGDRDKTKRPRMGRVASTLADRVVVTSDNPRTESPSAIIDEILTGVPKDRMGEIEVHADRAVAIRSAVVEAAPGDIVLIAGKGHETVQIALGRDGEPTEREFEDRGVALAALEERQERAVSPTGGNEPS